MESNNRRRGGALKWLAAALLGLTLITAVAQPAEAARFRRGRVLGGFRAYRMPFRGYSRGYYGAYPRYGYGHGGYGYRGVAPGYFYGGAYPYGYSAGYGGYYAPMMPGMRYSTYLPPMM